MDRIRIKIHVRNESDATLVLTQSELSSGEYTDRWSPPQRIVAWETAHFQGEGDFFGRPTTGTEGRVRYQIYDGAERQGELYIHWDSPLIESQYGNTFHIWCPINWEVSHWGGQGDNARLDIRLRRTLRRQVRNFGVGPRTFKFDNSDWDELAPGLPVVTVGLIFNRLFERLPGPLGELGAELLPEDWVPITKSEHKLCGGMIYAVMDYHHHKLLPLEQEKPPSDYDDPLYQYLRDRLWDSFDVFGEGYRYIAYSAPSYPNGDEGFMQNVLGLARGRSWISYREEWPKIQDDIDANTLSPVALVRSDELNIADHHQVLVYGYLRSGQDVELYAYDPNEPAGETVLRFNVTSTSGEVHVSTTSFSKKRIFCFFRTNNYEPKIPPVGRPFRLLKLAVMETTNQTPPLSTRAAVLPTSTPTSISQWMMSL